MKKILLTVVAIIIFIFVIVFNNNVNDESNITVYVEIIKDDLKVEEVIVICDESSFIIELKNNFELDIKDGYLYKVGFLECYDKTNSYIALYVNDNYSIYGIEKMKLNNNDKVSFIYTNI